MLTIHNKCRRGWWMRSGTAFLPQRRLRCSCVGTALAMACSMPDAAKFDPDPTRFVCGWISSAVLSSSCTLWLDIDEDLHFRWFFFSQYLLQSRCLVYLRHTLAQPRSLIGTTGMAQKPRSLFVASCSSPSRFFVRRRGCFLELPLERCPRRD